MDKMKRIYKPLFGLICMVFVACCARAPQVRLSEAKTAGEADALQEGLIAGLRPGFVDIHFGVHGLKSAGATRSSIPTSILPTSDWVEFYFPRRMTKEQSIERNAAHYAKTYPESATEILLRSGYTWRKLRGTLEQSNRRFLIKLTNRTYYELYWLPEKFMFDDVGSIIEVEGLLSKEKDILHFDKYKQSFFDLSHLIISRTQ